MGADGVLRTAVYVQRVRRDGSLGRWIWKWVTLGPGAMGGHGGRLRSTLARGSTEGEEVERTVAFGPLLSIVIPTSDTQK